MMAFMTLMAGNTPWTGLKISLAIKACNMSSDVDAGSGHVWRWISQAGFLHNLLSQIHLKILADQGSNQLFLLLQSKKKLKVQTRKVLSTAAYFLICRRVRSKSRIRPSMRNS